MGTTGGLTGFNAAEWTTGGLTGFNADDSPLPHVGTGDNRIQWGSPGNPVCPPVSPAARHGTRFSVAAGAMGGCASVGRERVADEPWRWTEDTAFARKVIAARGIAVSFHLPSRRGVYALVLHPGPCVEEPKWRRIVQFTWSDPPETVVFGELAAKIATLRPLFGGGLQIESRSSRNEPFSLCIGRARVVVCIPDRVLACRIVTISAAALSFTLS